MAWITLKEAATRGPSRATWERRVAASLVPSYVNEFGRRMVWFAAGDTSLASVQSEIQELNGGVGQVLERLNRMERSLNELRRSLHDQRRWDEQTGQRRAA